MLRFALSLVFVPLLSAAPSRAADFFASPDGSGDGTRRAPWPLARALEHPAAVRPGDTLWLLPGVYRGTFESRLRGRPGAPIRVRALPGARVTLDGGRSGGKAILTVDGAHTWYEGFEVTSSDPKRESSENGPHPTDIERGTAIVTVQRPGSAVGVRLLDLAIHDARQGIGLWAEAVDAEVSGCVIWNNGWDGRSDRGHGHGIYTQNAAGRKVIAANAIFGQFGGGVVAYGSSDARLDGFEIAENTLFENGVSSRHDVDRNLLLGGGVEARDGLVRDNVTFFRSGSANNLGYDAGCSGMRVEGNTFVNLGGPALVLSRCARGLRLVRNTFVGEVEGAGRDARNRFAPRLERARVFVRESRSGSGRLLVTVLGAQGLDAIEVDVGGRLSPGERYTVRNAEDFLGAPLLEGTWRGGPLRLPLKGLRRAPPFGGGRATPHDPALAVFVVLPERGAGPEEPRRGRVGRQDDERRGVAVPR